MVRRRCLRRWSCVSRKTGSFHRVSYQARVDVDQDVPCETVTHPGEGNDNVQDVLEHGVSGVVQTARYSGSYSGSDSLRLRARKPRQDELSAELHFSLPALVLAVVADLSRLHVFHFEAAIVPEMFEYLETTDERSTPSM
jgi:hypothetical protein